MADPLLDEATLLAQALQRLEEVGQSGVEDLLREHPAKAAAIRQKLQALDAMGMLSVPDSIDGEIPEQLGEFFIKSRIGKGGMGVVYLAAQPSLNREVALKLIRPEHLYFPNARERFQREIEAIARLQHPAIVRVYSTGVEKGVPYFSMEHVQGVSLDRLLSKLDREAPHRLTEADVRKALHELGGPAPEVADQSRPRRWVEVCIQWLRELAEAVDYAHHRDVFHRDIKPSNVMITWSLRAMLLDFGLATTNDGNSMTRTGAQLGSLPYMAPEQIRGDRACIDGRTDIYALGVLLYEVLTLCNPFHESSTNDSETRERIVAGTPSPVRQSNVGVSWDAETVCHCAMAPEPDQRYQTAALLVADLQNLLDLRPIAAKRPGTAVRVRRFLRRRPALATAIAMALLFVLVTPTAIAVREFTLRQQVEDEASTRADILDFFREELLAAVALDKLGKDATMREVLDAASTKIEERFENRPLVEAAIRRTIGDTYRSLGEPDTAERHLQRSLDLYRQYAGEAGRETVDVERELGMVYSVQGRQVELEALLRRNYETCKSAFGLEDGDTQATANNLGLLLTHMGRHKEAEKMLLEVVDVRLRVLGEERSTTMDAMNNLGIVYRSLGQYEEAEYWVRRELDICARKNGYDNPSTLISRHNLANLLGSMGRVKEGIAEFETVITASREVRGAGHPGTLHAMLSQSRLLGRAGRHADAERVLDRLLADSHALQPTNPTILVARVWRADAWGNQGRRVEAHAELDGVVADCEMHKGDHFRTVALARFAKARLLVAEDRRREADGVFTDVITNWEGEPNTSLAAARLHHARNLIQLHRVETAQEQLEMADAFYGEGAAGGPVQRDIVEELIRACTLLGNEQAAEAWRARLAALSKRL